MKILLAQLNPIVGDLRGNFEKVYLTIKNYHGAEIIVFPELTLTGYPPNDLLLRRGFVEEQLAYVEDIRKLTTETEATIVLGVVTRNLGVGKPLQNSAVVFKNGLEIMRYHKQLLPTYNVFDEARYFEPGKFNQQNYFKVGGKSFGLLICEDCWNDEAICDAPIYPTNPVANTMGLFQPDALITINASPSHIGKHTQRYDMYNRLSKKYGVPIVYVNQVGGQDSLIFDGHSFVAFPKSRVRCGVGFLEEMWLVNLDGTCLEYTTNCDENALIYNHLVLGLRDYMKKNGFKSAVVGSSGGIDSAVVLALASDAIGAENVTAITMPAQYSSKGSVDDSVLLCKNLGIRLYNRNIEWETQYAIETFSKTFKDEITPPKRLTIENLQPRIRMRILMEFSNEYGALVLNTTNKSEASVGYGTIFGDVAGGLGVLMDVYKMEVYDLARWYNEFKSGPIIPTAIIDKAPSAELWEGQKDTDSLPPYPVLDALLKLYLERDLLTRTEISLNKGLIQDLTLKEIKRILKLVDGAEYKRRMAPPCLRIHRRAFGFGRNLPITQRHPVSFENVI